VKRELPIDKRLWQPSPLPGQIVLVSTVAADGTPNVAPKSWVTMVAFDGPRVAFGCNVTHTTYRNVEATRAFVLNVVPAALADRVWELSDRHGAERLAASGLTLASSVAVAAPRVSECTAHLECTLDEIKAWGDEVLIFGSVVAVASEGGYDTLDPVFFLEDGLYAALDAPRRRAT
jgi:flavin reductase (DIM6/NTAB) family NADH-FMN oxidoreductase RutF